MKSNLDFDDNSILFRLKNGDEQALQVIISKYKAVLAKSILRMLKSREDTEEVLQELFVRLWTHRDRIDADKPIKGYLYRIAENLVFDMLRKSAQQKRLIGNYLANITEVYSHVEEGVIDAETKSILHHAIQQMPAQRRRVFELCKLEGKSYEEVSEQLSISIATINSHITNAHNFLRSYFQQHPELFAILLTNALLFS